MLTMRCRRMVSVQDLRAGLTAEPLEQEVACQVEPEASRRVPKLGESSRSKGGYVMMRAVLNNEVLRRYGFITPWDFAEAAR